MAFRELIGGCGREYFTVLLVSSLLSGVEGVLQPLLIRSIFDQVGAHNVRGFTSAAVAYFALSLSGIGISLRTALWSKSLENRIVASLTGRLLLSYYHKEYLSVLQNGSGYFINRIYSDVREGVVPLLTLIQTTVTQSMLLVSLSGVLIYLSWRAFIALAVIIPLAAIVGAKVSHRIKSLTFAEREHEGTVLAMLTKFLAAFRSTKGFHLLQGVEQLFDDKLGCYLAATYQKVRFTQLFQGIQSLAIAISDLLSLLVGAVFVMKGTLTIGGYLAFVNAFWRAVATLMQIFKSVPDFHSFSAITVRVASFLSSPAPRYYRNGSSVSATNISFSYGGVPIVANFSLQLAVGESVAIIGPNGCGKTTLANIFSGYLAPSHGQVVLPERISSVTLPITFPPMKVKDLIADRHVLTMMGLCKRDILEMPADELSVGQQQKLAISLALSQDADLYVVDEPLANLDQESRDIALDLIFEKTEKKTLIVVMHGSEEHHARFDRIIKISKASIATTHDQNACTRTNSIGFPSFGVTHAGS
jgi:ATP-binding cassette subfamily B protein